MIRQLFAAIIIIMIYQGLYAQSTQSRMDSIRLVKAKNGDAFCQYLVANRYYLGTDKEMHDFKNAFYWYLKSARNGYASAMGTVGSMYENGQGTSKNAAKAVYWYKKGAKLNNAYCQFNLTRAYLDYGLLPVNYHRAKYWLRRAEDNEYSQDLIDEARELIMDLELRALQN